MTKRWLSRIPLLIWKHRSLELQAVSTAMIVGAVDVLEYGERTLIWSAHETVGGEQAIGRMNTVLRVADALSGKTFLETVLNSNVQARVPDPFFVQADMLYYVKERKELAAVQLRELPGGR
jgi:hypothetical protein